MLIRKYLFPINIIRTRPSSLQLIILMKSTNLTFDLKKSLGPNSIPIYILKVFNYFFSIHLSNIFNLCFETGIFSLIFARLQSSSRFIKKMILYFIKITDLFPYYQFLAMYSFLDDNNLISDRQFGFRAENSTNHALISIPEFIKKKLDEINLVGGIFIDLEKAFDTVNFDILCNALPYYGFIGKILSPIKSFLDGRKQTVSINGFESPFQPLNFGVPQCSTLGPLLFFIYINDFKYSLSNSISSHFADDTCIIYSSKRLKSLENIINNDLKSASQWLQSNRLFLNRDKTKLIIFHSKQKKN